MRKKVDKLHEFDGCALTTEYALLIGHDNHVSEFDKHVLSKGTHNELLSPYSDGVNEMFN